MALELETIPEEAWNDKKLEADILWKHFLNEDRLPSSRDYLRRKDSKDLSKW